MAFSLKNLLSTLRELDLGVSEDILVIILAIRDQILWWVIIIKTTQIMEPEKSAAQENKQQEEQIPNRTPNQQQDQVQQGEDEEMEQEEQGQPEGQEPEPSKQEVDDYQQDEAKEMEQVGQKEPEDNEQKDQQQNAEPKASPQENKQAEEGEASGQEKQSEQKMIDEAEEKKDDNQEQIKPKQIAPKPEDIKHEKPEVKQPEPPKIATPMPISTSVAPVIHQSKPQNVVISHHKAQTPQERPVNQLATISFQSQKYINALETSLKNKQKQLSESLAQQASLEQKLGLLEQETKQLKFAQLQKTQQILVLNKKQKVQERELEALKLKVVQLDEELVCYREVGDIKAIQRRVEELEGLVDSYKNEIETIKTQNAEGGKEEDKIGKTMTGKQYLSKLAELETQNQSQSIRIKQLEFQATKRNGQSQENVEIMDKMDNQLKNKMERIANLEEQLFNQRTNKTKLQQNLQQKVQSLQQELHAYTNPGRSHEKDKQMHEQSIKSELVKMETEKDIVFREYLKLELEHKSALESLKQIRSKYQQACKDLRAVKKQMVSKKDYEEVLLKYRKCKACLEKAIRQSKAINEGNNSNNGNSEGDNINQGTNIGENQQQNLMKKYMQILNGHIQQSIGFTKGTNSIMENVHIQKYAGQLKLKEQQIDELHRKYQRLEKLNTIFERELLYKNTLLDNVIKDFANLSKEYEELKRQKLGVQENLAENISAKSALKRLETKSAALLVRNRKTVTQMEKWKKLYEDIKSKYELFIKRDPAFMGEQNQNQDKVQSKPNIQNELKNKVIEQGQIQQENIETTKGGAKPKVPTTQAETQTQGLNQLYYKEIKQTLSAVKKFPELIKNTTANYQKIGKDLEDYKKKYDQVNDKFNIKFRTLQNQKNENDSWREQTKRQITGEFQDIRELIDGDRLLTCLRKAKNLIEYLEQQDEEEGQASAE